MKEKEQVENTYRHSTKLNPKSTTKVDIKMLFYAQIDELTNC